MELNGIFATETYESVDFGVSVRGDRFPSVEVYRDRGSGPQALIQSKEVAPFLELPVGLFSFYPHRDEQYPDLSQPEAA